MGDVIGLIEKAEAALTRNNLLSRLNGCYPGILPEDFVNQLRQVGGWDHAPDLEMLPGSMDRLPVAWIRGMLKSNYVKQKQ